MKDQSVTHIDERSNRDLEKTETPELDSSSSTNQQQLHSRDFQKAWSKRLIILAYIILIFTTLVESFAADSTGSLSSYATSSFNNHTLISTAQIVYKITAVCGYPILAKLADLLGRGEGFGLTIASYSLAYILFATCKNGGSYIIGEVFFAIGRIGFKLFQQIFLADTTNLINRGVWSTLPNAITGIPSTYAGSYIQDGFLEHSTWRWAYGCFAIVLGVCVVPLTTIMIIIDHKAKARGLRASPKILENIDQTKPWYYKTYKILFYEIDLIGGGLLVLGIALFFIPFTLTGKATPYRWSEARLIAMIVVGFIIIIGFIIWNFFLSSHRPLANRSPFIPKQSLASKTIIIILIMNALDAMENSAFNVYFSTVLQVGGYYTAGQATRIDNAKKISIDIASVITGILMKYTQRTKIFVFIGVPLLILGHGLLVWFMNRDGIMERTILLYVMEIFTGVGRAFYQCSLQVTIQAIAGVNGIAMSTGFLFCFQMIGALVGTAIAGGIWNEILLDKLHKYLPPDEVKNSTKIFKSIKVAMSYKKGTDIRNAISLSYRETIQIIGYVALGIIGPMLILMFWVQEVKLDEKRDLYSSDEETIDEHKLKDTKKHWYEF